MASSVLSGSTANSNTRNNIVPIIKISRNPSAEALPETPSSNNFQSDDDYDYERRDQSAAYNNNNNDNNNQAGIDRQQQQQPQPITSPTTTVRATKSSQIFQDNAATSDILQSPTKLTRRQDNQHVDIGVDPLSLHILKRTGTQPLLTSRMLRQDNNDTSESHPDAPDRNATIRASTNSSLQSKRTDSQNTNKDKKKGVSFLGRFLGGSKKKSDSLSDDDNESVRDDRIEGLDAAVFSQPIGFTPQFPPPPKYIRVRSHNKGMRDFNRVFLAQELTKHPVISSDNSRRQSGATNNHGSSTSLAMPKHKSGAVWAMKFSVDGRYLAVGGQDKIVSVWEVLSSQEDRSAHEMEEDANGSGSNTPYTNSRGVRLNAPVFRTEPLREYVGHTADVLDLSWSKNNFLLSSSMDKTVRLWHISRKECLCAFQHSDFVTSIVFHPKDDRFFLAGSLDSKLRLWSIPDKSVAFSVELPDLITAVAFTPDGRLAIAGCLNGLCLFYETEGLRYHTQVHVRSTHGRNAKGSKITGIQAMTFPPDDPNGETKLLITSNDSRVRLYNVRDKSLEVKFKGHQNTCSQIHATFSDDAQYVISGSEDRKVYIWNANPGPVDKKSKRPLEYFEAHPAIVTVAIMAPTKTRQLLGSSGDPIYDLCNPPPVTLVSRSESISSSKHRGGKDDSEEKRNANLPTPPGSSDAPQAAPKKVVEESPAYLSRATHTDGNIIVTADYLGRIKIFRQDCAYSKRRVDTWDTASTFSKKIGTGLFSSNSVRRPSTSQNSPDRILSWRNSIASNNSAASSRGRRGSVGDQSSVRNRSPSIGKSVSEMSLFSNVTNSTIPKLKLNDNTIRASARNPRPRTDSSNSAYVEAPTKVKSRDPSPTSSFTNIQGATNPLYIQDTGQSMAYYNLDIAPSTNAGYLRPDKLDRRQSIVSSEENSPDELMSDSESEAMKCKGCGGTAFRAKKSRGGDAKLVCVKCNKPC